jgi:hypothetical protein
MRSRPRKLLIESLHIVHEGFTFRQSCSILRCLNLIFNMRLIVARSRKLWYFLSNKICYSLPAGISFLFLIIVVNKAYFAVKSWPWSFLSLLKVSFSKLSPNFASRVSWGSKVGCSSTHVMIGSWGLLCLCQVLSVWCSDYHSILFYQLLSRVVVGRSWLKWIVIKNYLVSRLTLISQAEGWWFVENSCTFCIVVLRSRTVLVVVNKSLTHRTLLSILNNKKTTVM